MRRTVAGLALVFGLALGLSGCHGGNKAPEQIVFGQALPLTGWNANLSDATSKPVYEMWIEELNDEGGLYIDEYKKRIPVKLVQRDDESDVDVMKAQMEALMLEDKVHFMLAPVGTDFLYEAAPLANRYGYILMGGPGGAIKLKEIISGLPYFFSVLNFADTQMPVLAELYEDMGVEKVAIVFANDLHGVEYSGVLVPELALRDIDVVMIRTCELNDPEIAAELAEAMTDAQALEADAFVVLAYPDAIFPMPGVAMELGWNPKALHGNVGVCFASFRDAYGAEGVEGITGPGAWNASISEDAADFEDRFVERWPDVGLDYWGQLQYYSGCQFFAQAIEAAGTLDQEKVRELMATRTFDTAMGPMSFENGLSVSHPGEIGQWQDGVFEVIDPGGRRTADPVYPKPEWPAPPEEAP